MHEERRFSYMECRDCIIPSDLVALTVHKSSTSYNHAAILLENLGN